MIFDQGGKKPKIKKA